MENPISLYGSINLTKLIELAKSKNKCFYKSEKTGAIYVNVDIYIKPEVDNYGNSASIRTNFKESSKEERHYFGNFKMSAPYVEPTVQASDFADFDDLGF